MKYSLDSSNFLEEISSLSHSIVFLYFFALITAICICLCFKAGNMCPMIYKTYLVLHKYHVPQMKGELHQVAGVDPGKECMWQGYLSVRKNLLKPVRISAPKTQGLCCVSSRTGFYWMGLSVSSLQDHSFRRSTGGFQEVVDFLHCITWNFRGGLDCLWRWIQEWFPKLVGLPKATSNPLKLIQTIVPACPSLVLLS